MRILVLGGSGLLGSDLVPALRAAGHEVASPTSQELDITVPSAFNAALGAWDWIVNSAAYTAVDRAESEPEQAAAINAGGARNAAAFAARIGARAIFISTDYVFGGEGELPRTESDATDPKGVYARTKLAGELATLNECPNGIVVRTSWLFGENGPCFPRTILKRLEAREPLRVVNDQFGRPTWTVALADALLTVMQSDLPAGTYHAASGRPQSWHQFALLIARIHAEISRTPEQPVLPVPTAAFPTPAERPRNSVLSTAKLEGFGVHLSPDLRAGIEAIYRLVVKNP